MLSKGALMTEKIIVFKHNSICIDVEGRAVYVDPFEMDETPHDAAFILVTHDHYDHFSPEAIEKVANENTVLVVPENMKGKAAEVSAIVGKIEYVNPGMNYDVDGLRFETVAAYNILKPFHPKSAGWVGYIISVDGKRIYVAGDTDATKEAKAVKCDIALVPVGGTYTMDAKKAAELINTIAPEVAIPVHYGLITGTSKNAGEEFSRIVKSPVKVEVRI